MSFEFFPAVVACFVVLLLPMREADGQSVEGIDGDFPESVILPTDSEAVRLLSVARAAARSQQWPQAVLAVRRAAETGGDRLMRVAPGRHLPITELCQARLARMPPPARAAYRSIVDAQARARFELGRQSGEDAPLIWIVRRLLLSSVGDDAAFLLGQRAWERGQPVLAAKYWQSLLAPEDADTHNAFAVYHPDTDVDPAEIRARLILCARAAGRVKRARAMLASFRQRDRDAVGDFGGRTGRLADIIADQLDRWDPAARTPDRIAEGSIDAGGRLWSVTWSPYVPAANKPQSSGTRAGRSPLTALATEYDGTTFVCDAWRVLAFDTATGQAAWPVSGEPAALIDDATIHASQTARPAQSLEGVPRYALAIRDNRLFARMGAPVTSRSVRELQPLASELVCLEIGESQGKELWRVSADRFGATAAFEGTPVIDAGRVLSVIRSGEPVLQLTLVCFDAEDGRMLWSKDVCSTLVRHSAGNNGLSHVTPVVGECGVVLSTGSGAVISLDPHDGRFQWAVTYESRREAANDVESPVECSSVLPLIHAGIVFVAPPDSDFVFAINEATGGVLWQIPLPDQILHLLGVGDGKLIVSGTSLWGLDVESGRVCWGGPCRNPEHAGYGRGLLVNGLVLWPKRRSIEARSQRSGQPVRSPLPLSAWNESGGNLTMVNGTLTIAGPDRLTAFQVFVD